MRSLGGPTSLGRDPYHFGTREELLLAVLERSFDRFVLSLAARSWPGRPCGSGWPRSPGDLGHYGRPEYVAVMQIHLN